MAAKQYDYLELALKVIYENILVHFFCIICFLAVDDYTH